MTERRLGSAMGSGRRERHVGGPGRDVDGGRRTWQSRAVSSVDNTASHKHTQTHIQNNNQAQGQ